MRKYDYEFADLDYMEEILAYFALSGWYEIDFAKGFYLLCAAKKQCNPPPVHLLLHNHHQDETFLLLV
jgi:hypothetical protein